MTIATPLDVLGLLNLASDGSLTVSHALVGVVEALERDGLAMAEAMPHGRYRLTITAAGRRAVEGRPAPRMFDRALTASKLKGSQYV